MIWATSEQESYIRSPLLLSTPERVGDEKITVRISQQTDAEVEEESEIRIRVGNLGNLAESQVIYARIRDAL
jgi:hypothetical protein